MESQKKCIACEIVASTFTPPGGIVFEDRKWLIALRANPIRFPCLPLIILKRHCEDIAELDQDESLSLGKLMQLTGRVLNDTLHPAKVHFGMYAEDVKHLHIHVFPRMSNMPAGNIPNVLLGQWFTFLHSLGLKKAYSNEVVSEYAIRLRAAYQEFSKGQNVI